MTKYLFISTIFLTTTLLTNLYAQHSSFYLKYVSKGLVPLINDINYPIIYINGEILFYTIEKKTGKYRVDKYDNFNDTIHEKYSGTYKLRMRPTSIDSMITLIKNLKDTTIFESNPCIIDGSIFYLKITNGKDTVKYELMNTFDKTALKFVDIINTYLPTDNKIWVTEQLIKDCEDCWTEKRKRWAEDDKKNKK